MCKYFDFENKNICLIVKLVCWLSESVCNNFPDNDPCHQSSPWSGPESSQNSPGAVCSLLKSWRNIQSMFANYPDCTTRAFLTVLTLQAPRYFSRIAKIRFKQILLFAPMFHEFIGKIESDFASRKSLFAKTMQRQRFSHSWQWGLTFKSL